jgi:hypothetical protein
MPNGKKVRDCTFGYCRKIGGVIARVGHLGRPKQVVGLTITDKEADAVASAVMTTAVRS